jgi:hypothetical protein
MTEAEELAGYSKLEEMRACSRLPVRIQRAIFLITFRNDWRALDELLGSESHPAQLEWLCHSMRARENLLHPGNGWGKTFVIAKKHIYYHLRHFGEGEKYRTLNIAITQEQSEFVQDGIVRLLSASPILKFMIDSRSVVKYPRARVRFTNGALVQFGTTKKKAESVEGKEFGYISADEVALEPHIEFIRDYILLPRLRAWKDSRLDFHATPKGQNAYWRIAEAVKRGGGYVRSGSSFENPHIDHELLRYQISMWPQNKIDQVIYGKFVDTAESMFASRVPVLFNDALSLTSSVVRGRRYVEGWDLARGRKGKQSDQTVGFRADKTDTPAIITKRWAFQLPWTEAERENLERETGRVARGRSTEYEIRNAQRESGADVLLDSTGVGDTLFGMLRDIVRPVDFRGGNKDRILDHLQAVIDCGALRSPFIPELAEEMTLYTRDDTLLATDNLMALAILAQNIPVVRPRVARIVPSELVAPVPRVQSMQYGAWRRKYARVA